MHAVVLDIQREGFGEYVERTRRVELPDGDSQLESLQELVGGYIEAIGLWPNVTAYLNEEGKLIDLPVNHTASRLALACEAIAPMDYIAGPLVVIGFDPNTGENQDIPEDLAVILGASLAGEVA